MITISVHSYKGGTGRTLAVAQLAVLLTRFKRSVVAIDLDVEAPGLAARLESTFKSSPQDQGLVRHAQIFQQTSKLIDLAQFSITLHPKFQLLTPGNPFGDRSAYWKTLSQMNHFEGESVVSYFERLKAEIAQKVGPDYLLIDAPSGFSSLAGICVNLLPDIVISLSTNEIDSLLGANRAARNNEERRYQGHPVPKRIYYALCRYPDQFEGDHGVTQLEASQLSDVLDLAKGTISSGLRQPTDIQRIFLLRSEPRLQMGSALPIPFAGESMTSSVVHDYCDLFGEVVPELADELSTLRAGVRITRSYYLLADAGLMINPADQALNVSFRVDTWQNLIDSLVTSVAKVSSPTLAQEALYDAGYVAAKDFSEYLKSQWAADLSHQVPPLSVQAKLKEWCAFDSTVGFGRFDGEFSSEFAGEVVVYNNFLIARRAETDQNLCGFMIGYISRILEVIFAGRRVAVNHDLEADCGQFTKHDPPECRFRFAAVEEIPER